MDPGTFSQMHCEIRQNFKLGCNSLEAQTQQRFLSFILPKYSDDFCMRLR